MKKKSQKIEKIVAEERGKTPPSASEQLERARLMLELAGFDANLIHAKEREYTSAISSKTHKYTSPIEFSVSGIRVWLLGHILMVNGDRIEIPLLGSGMWGTKEIYQTLIKEIKSRTKKAQQQTVKPDKPIIPLFAAKYLKLCLIEA